MWTMRNRREQEFKKEIVKTRLSTSMELEKLSFSPVDGGKKKRGGEIHHSTTILVRDKQLLGARANP